MAAALHQEVFNQAKEDYHGKVHYQEFLDHVENLPNPSNGVHMDARHFFFTARKAIATKFPGIEEKEANELFRKFYWNYLDKKHGNLLHNLYWGNGFSEKRLPGTSVKIVITGEDDPSKPWYTRE